MFTFSSLKYQAWWTGLLQPTQAVKILFKQKKNQTQNFKLENVKNQVQIDKGSGMLLVPFQVQVYIIFSN